MNQNLAGLYSKGTLLHNGAAGNSAAEVYYLPSGGQNSIALVCLVTMGDATDLVCTVQTADDATGTNATALVKNIPLYLGTSGSQMAKQTSAKAFTQTAATGSFVYVFEVPPTIIPADKYIGIAITSGGAADVVSVIALEDTYLKA